VLVPDDLVRTITSWAGPRGAAWLASLPSRVEALADMWGLRVGEPYVPSGYTSLAVRVTRGGEPCVLKVSAADDEPPREAAALRAYGGGAAVTLLEADGDALLLERCEPGALLSSRPDDECARVVAETLVELWRAPVPDGVPPLDLDGWAETLARPSRVPYRDEALDALSWLRAGPSVLLHGDLHGGNVLSARRRPWLAIDPKGAVGDPAFDLAAVVRDRAAPGLVERRHRIVCEVTGCDPDRVRAWALVKCVEGAAWSYEVGDARSGDEFVAAAHLVAALRSGA
jgi:streptomycin 6-kinase